MSGSSSTKREVPENDPYTVLGVEFGASDTEISKAYRQLARTLHPDKLVAQNLTPLQLAQSAARFQEIQTARAFLLDADHAASRRKYDAQRASDRVRQAANQQRDEAMSGRRKQMLDELNRREADAAAASSKSAKRKFTQPDAATTGSRAKSSTSEADSATSRDLDRQGRALREQYAAKAAAAELRERDQAALLLQQRQIRLKWSRKKIKAAGEASPSEDSLAKMLSRQFGTVEAVQMIGDKGNVALVTFQKESSCTNAVAAFATSDTWRATYVSKDKQQSYDSSLLSASRHSMEQQQRDHENVSEWKSRQASEREALLRRMERGEEGYSVGAAASEEAAPSKRTRPFPPKFPDEYNALASGIDMLERAEDELLRGLVSDETLQGMKVVRTS